MKYSLIVFLSVCSCLFCSDLSFYRGFLLWKEYREQQEMPYNFEQVLAGMRAAEEGQDIECDKEEFYKELRAFQEELFEKQCHDNLAHAEKMLKEVAEMGAVEVVPGKLYYKTIVKGDGRTVLADSAPLLTYRMWVHDRNSVEPAGALQEPSPIVLEDTIEGFMRGVVGMVEGEERTLFIHPDLGYRGCSRVAPNELVIFDVKIHQVGEVMDLTP